MRLTGSIYDSSRPGIIRSTSKILKGLPSEARLARFASCEVVEVGEVGDRVLQTSKYLPVSA